MTTPTKPKKTKAPKKATEKVVEEYMDLEEVLQSHEDGLTALEEASNSHALNIDDLNDVRKFHNGEILELQELLVHSVNSLFWMSAIGIAVAITFAGVAVFRH